MLGRPNWRLPVELSLAATLLASAPLLATKLFMPPIRDAIVQRPRLTNMLNQSLGQALTLICAPAYHRW